MYLKFVKFLIKFWIVPVKMRKWMGFAVLKCQTEKFKQVLNSTKLYFEI